MRPHHARLLSDERGPWGLEVDRAPLVVVREDRVAAHEDAWVPDLFHALPRHGAEWARGTETQLFRQLHESLLYDRGITRQFLEVKWAEYRGLYHGLRQQAHRLVNSLLNELYASAIPAGKLRLIRSYPIGDRGELYRQFSLNGERAWQLGRTFPLLAAMIYRDQEQEDARQLIRHGAKLRCIADAAEVPMAFRRFKPGVINALDRSRAYKLLAKHPSVVAHHCPATAPKQRQWINAIGAAMPSTHFALWVAKHFHAIGHWRAVAAIIGDVNDWVSAGASYETTQHLDESEIERARNALYATHDEVLAEQLGMWWGNRTQALVNKPFNKAMSPSTVLRLSHEWHQHTAAMKAQEVPFPEPWYDSAQHGDYRIEPVCNAHDLSRYAYQLHNCASSYACGVASGEQYLYVVRNGSEKPEAMFELFREEKPQLGQLKGPYNKPVKASLRRAVRSWLTAQRKAHGIGRMTARASTGTSH